MIRFEREAKTLKAMIGLYCRDHHKPQAELCDECKALQEYALARLERCRYGSDKPKCSACTTHCYKPDMRDTVRDVMRYAGPRMLVRHPVMALSHTMDGLLHHPKTKGKDL
ncbi:MAG: nitrous oxide-stimulated promoter family protein [bacterium]|jgi:hypothetical protein